MRLEELKASRSKPNQPGGVLVCSKCGEKNTDDARACKTCKQSLYINCAVCGHENLRASPRCISCTHHLRPTAWRRAKKWVFETHGMLILKVVLVIGVSFVAARVILKVAEVEPAEPKLKTPATGDTALRPAPNGPDVANLDPKATPTSKKPAAKPGASATENDQLEGWRERYCAATVANGIVTVTGKALNKKNPSITGPFLASYASKFSVGPGAIKFRIRSPGGGPGKVELLPSGTDGDPTGMKTMPFTTTGGGWQEVNVPITSTGPYGMIRLYLPVQTQSVELDWIEVVSTGKFRRWDF